MDKRVLWLWSKISSVRWEDAWEERLRFLPPGACVMLTSPGSRALRIRAYTDQRTAKKLAGYFGGSVRRLREEIWNKELSRELRPLRVRGRLVVFSESKPWESHRSAGDRPPSIFIPASMAFGTGSHPTTAGCLRLLADTSLAMPPDGWRMADLGTGSGILAIAAKKLGAAEARALDYDRVCIREARKNARKNRIVLEEIREVDVHRWQPSTPFHLLTANLFSDTLISSAPILSKAVLPGGVLIFSGVLRDQLPKVADALRKNGFGPPRTNSRGKWVVGVTSRKK